MQFVRFIYLFGDYKHKSNDNNDAALVRTEFNEWYVYSTYPKVYL